MQDEQIVGRDLGDVGLVVLSELDRDPVDGLPYSLGQLATYGLGSLGLMPRLASHSRAKSGFTR